MKRDWKALALAVSLAQPVAAQVPAGGEIVVNIFTTGSQDDPAVAMTRDGRFVVVWESPQDDVGDAVLEPSERRRSVDAVALPRWGQGGLD